MKLLTTLISLVIYQSEVDKGKLTAVASFEKLTVWSVSPSSEHFVAKKGSRSKRQLFKTRYGG